MVDGVGGMKLAAAAAADKSRKDRSPCLVPTTSPFMLAAKGARERKVWILKISVVERRASETSPWRLAEGAAEIRKTMPLTVLLVGGHPRVVTGGKLC